MPPSRFCARIVRILETYSNNSDWKHGFLLFGCRNEFEDSLFLAGPVSAAAGFSAVSAPPQRAERVKVGQDILVDACTSGALGYDSLTILKGDYAVDNSASRLGRVTVKVRGRRASGPSKT
jgi:hypothetical protein